MKRLRCEVQLRRSSDRFFGLADRMALSRAKHPRILNCDGGRGLFSLGMRCNTFKRINTLEKSLTERTQAEA
jgi:hypothetical protein